MSHKQVFAQVKTLVDSEIKDVIEALNRIPNVWTVDSCEGYSEEGAGVSIYVGKRRNYIQTAAFANRLFSALSNQCVNVKVQWTYTNSHCPYVYLSFLKVDAASIASAIEPLGVYLEQNKPQNIECIPV